MRLVVSDPATELIQKRGGRLYVWVKKARCCGGFRTLATSSDPPKSCEFKRIPSGAGFELFVPEGLAQLPEELHIELRRFPVRVEAYWDGCAWVV
jgi:hypothetical protein